MLSMVEYVHKRMLDYPCHIAIDFTMGQGEDTVYLSKISDIVYSFDIQQEAINITKEKVSDNVRLILDSHENFDNYIDTYDIGVFNLGYLPTGDHFITTTLDVLKRTLPKAIQCMKQSLFIVCYIGHEEGYKESLWIDDYVSQLDHHYNVSTYRMMNKNKAPYVIEIQQRSVD